MPDRGIILKLPGGTFSLSVGTRGGSVSSSPHHWSLEEFLEAGGEEPGDPLDDQFSYGWYEGAIDALQS